MTSQKFMNHFKVDIYENLLINSTFNDVIDEFFEQSFGGGGNIGRDNFWKKRDTRILGPSRCLYWNALQIDVHYIAVEWISRSPEVKRSWKLTWSENLGKRLWNDTHGRKTIQFGILHHFWETNFQLIVNFHESY